MLLHKWDPIGIVGSDADDEYDAYADKAYVMLMDERATETEIAAYLFNIATEHMGLSDRDRLAERSQCTAKLLIGICSDFETH
ncbi:hypothetical protein [Bradyrhizobium sp. dw_78]|uniref:hypothetical protein n=1 Tax=Bradyrhizobium sp. dw_78 TaxID=2719793 RepID=UPI00201B9C8F|nr:hypothetical protein [Bradyrhizobium sp. dw_78]